MADLGNVSMLGIAGPPTKRLRVDSTASETSDMIGKLLGDLNDDLPEDLMADFDGSAPLLNSDFNSASPLPQTSSGSGSGNPANAASTSQPQTNAGQQGSASSFNSQAASPNPNVTINMYANSPRTSVGNSPLLPTLDTSANAASPQPTAISTSGDPTPILPAVSSTPANPPQQDIRTHLAAAPQMGVDNPAVNVQHNVPMANRIGMGMQHQMRMVPQGMAPGQSQYGMGRVAMQPNMVGHHPGMQIRPVMQHQPVHAMRPTPYINHQHNYIPSQSGMPHMGGMVSGHHMASPGMVQGQHGMVQNPHMVRAPQAHMNPHAHLQPSPQAMVRTNNPAAYNHPRGQYSDMSAMDPRTQLEFAHHQQQQNAGPMQVNRYGPVATPPQSQVANAQIKSPLNQQQVTPPSTQNQLSSLSSQSTSPAAAHPPSSSGVPSPQVPPSSCAQNSGTPPQLSGGGQQPATPQQNTPLAGISASNLEEMGVASSQPQTPQQQTTQQTPPQTTGQQQPVSGQQQPVSGQQQPVSGQQQPVSGQQQQPQQTSGQAQQPTGQTAGQQPLGQQQPLTGQQINQATSGQLNHIQPTTGQLQNVPLPGQNSNQPNLMAAQNQLMGPGIGGPNPTGQASDPEKRRQIQQQLVLLLHAHKCQRREREQQANRDFRPCTLPHCKTMKNVLNHMTECQAGRQCNYPHCASSRQIITHWRNCQRADCPVCLPLKHASLQHKRDGVVSSQQLPGGLMGGPQSNQAGGPMMAAAAGGGQMNFNHLGPQGAPGGLPGDNTQVYPVGGGQPGMRPHPYIHPPYQGTNSTNTTYPVPIPHIVSNPTQQWHQLVNPDLRQHLVRKLVEAIYPVHDPVALQDRRVTSLIQYAMKVEKVMFEAATSREEYYKLLAQKIYLIRKELEDRKRNKTKTQPIQPINGGDPVIHQPNMFYQDGPPTSNIGSLPPTPQTGQSVGHPGESNSPRPSASDLPPSLFGGLPPTPSTNDSKKEVLSQAQTNRILSPPSSHTADGPLPNSAGPSIKMEIKSEPSSSQKSAAQSRPDLPSTSHFAELPNIDSLPSIKSSTSVVTIDRMEDLAVLLGEISHMWEPFISSLGVSISVRSQIKITYANAPEQCLAAGLRHWVMTDENPAYERITSVLRESLSNKALVHKVEEFSGITHSALSSVKPLTRMDSLNEAPPTSSKAASPIVSMDTDTPTPVPRPPPAAHKGMPKIKVVPDPSLKKVFTAEELEKALRPVFNVIWNLDPDSFPFRQPVDPRALGIPDYFDIVKNPIDLCTVSMRLEEGEYKTPWEFCQDIWLMFDNAWLYNRKTSRVYRYCSKLTEVFDQHIDSAMQKLGYCCGKRHTFVPQVLYCYGKPLCTIPRDTPYYSYQNRGSESRYVYCPKCFQEVEGDAITVGDDLMTVTRIKKMDFVEMKNDSVDREPFVTCIHCGREMHAICVLHLDSIWPEGFQCDSCLKIKGTTRKESRFSAKRLPTTKLAIYLEEKVNTFVRSLCEDAGEITIRIVSSSDKILDTRPQMKERFGSEFPSQFPYRTKAMLVFEEIDGEDVCFFGMHVQEYGSDCQAPNTRRTYISYLDSVHFFRPRHLRTTVYHEILIRYLEFCKNNGFLTAHIWACPPSEGDDYIFHCHPLEQKIPKPKRLVEWYKKMLDTGKSENVVYDYSDIFKYCTDENVAVTEIPYFEGDFWPNVVEETIREHDEEEREREASEQASIEGRAPKKVGKRNTNKKGSKKAGGTRSKSSKKSGVNFGGDDLSQKIYQTMEKHKDVFFIVMLQPPNTAASPLPGTTDPDQLVPCDLMDGRDAFLTMARERHWEFSSLRRAKYSTMAMLKELHTQSNDGFVYTCNNCHLHMESYYHCKECEDFDMCTNCYREIGHTHPMEKIAGLGLDDDIPSTELKQKDPKEQRKASMERLLQSVVHASKCADPHCKQPGCIKMKRVLRHMTKCHLRSLGNCVICKRFLFLAYAHAKTCTEEKCSVPGCSAIKAKLRDQRNQQRVRQNRFMQQRMARMHQMSTTPVQAPPSTQPPLTTTPHTSPKNPATPSKGSPASSSIPNVNTYPSPAAAIASPAAPRSVGKGGPRTPAEVPTPGQRVMVPSPVSTSLHQTAMSMSSLSKPDQAPIPAPNVTVSAAPGLPGELTITRVNQEQQIISALNSPDVAERERANAYVRRNPQLQEKLRQMQSERVSQDIMPHHPSPPGMYASGGNPGAMVHQPQMRPMYTPHQQHAYMMQRQAQSQFAAGGPNHPHQYHMPVQGMMQQPQAYQNVPPQQPQQTHSHSQLQQILQTRPVQQYGNPQGGPYHMAPSAQHQLGPPPQYPRHSPVPQTAGFPQVLGQQNRGMATPQHLSPQMHSQYAGGQAMGMDHGGMQPDPGYLYQTQPQYNMNNSNNNSNVLGGVPSMLTPTDMLTELTKKL